MLWLRNPLRAKDRRNIYCGRVQYIYYYTPYHGKERHSQSLEATPLSREVLEIRENSGSVSFRVIFIEISSYWRLYEKTPRGCYEISCLQRICRNHWVRVRHRISTGRPTRGPADQRPPNVRATHDPRVTHVLYCLDHSKHHAGPTLVRRGPNVRETEPGLPCPPNVALRATDFFSDFYGISTQFQYCATVAPKSVFHSYGRRVSFLFWKTTALLFSLISNFRSDCTVAPHCL